MLSRQIVIISKGRADTISTPSILKGFEKNIIIVVYEKEYEAYRNSPRLTGINIHKTSINGLIPTRNYVLDTFGDKRDWIYLLDDNLIEWRVITPYGFQVCEAEHFFKIMEQDLGYCDKNNIHLYGTATNDNLLYNWGAHCYWGNIQHKCCAIKKTNIRYSERIFIREEFEITAKHILIDGAVYRHCALYAHRKHYQKGGIGSRKYRDPLYRKDTLTLMQMYPNLFRIYKKPLTKYGTEIAFNLHKRSQIEKWRREMFIRGKIE